MWLPDTSLFELQWTEQPMCICWQLKVCFHIHLLRKESHSVLTLNLNSTCVYEQDVVNSPPVCRAWHSNRQLIKWDVEIWNFLDAWCLTIKTRKFKWFAYSWMHDFVFGAAEIEAILRDFSRNEDKHKYSSKVDYFLHLKTGSEILSEALLYLLHWDRAVQRHKCETIPILYANSCLNNSDQQLLATFPHIQYAIGSQESWFLQQDLKAACVNGRQTAH